MNLSNQTVIITGAGGFVGSHLAESLIERGCRLRCFVRYNSRDDLGMLRDAELGSRGVEIIRGDLKDIDAVQQAVDGVDVVFHLASLIAIPYSYIHPREVIETNVIGTLNVLSAARDACVSKVVHTSTSEVYGTALYVPIDEKHPLQGQSPYSASKIGADSIAESFYRTYDLPVATIRPFNIYGPRQSARAVIPTIITQALKQGEVKLGHIDSTRDFTYVKDTVRAFLKIAENEGTIGKVFNIGSNFEISIEDIVRKVGRILGKELRIIHESERKRPEKSEVRRLRADSTIANKTFGWAPQVSIDQGLAETIDWIDSNLSKFKTGEYTI
jgi:dTDP-glucose 4,6-dehydratase